MRRTRSAPAQNAVARPGDDDRAQVVVRLEVAAQLVAQLGVERVAALGTVDDREPDVRRRLLPVNHRLPRRSTESRLVDDRDQVALVHHLLGLRRAARGRRRAPR